MSKKYPEGAVVVKKSGGQKRKVLGCAGEVRFLSEHSNQYGNGTLSTYDYAHTVSDLERDGWTVEEAPWKPENGSKVAIIDSMGNFDLRRWDDDERDNEYLLVGNCYQPNSQALKDAQARVLKAYRGV